MRKCKDCPFYSGVECHGHGDFWGECSLAWSVLKKFKAFDVDVDIWTSICYDDTECKFSKFLRIDNNEIN